ncbi:hypothetical protein JHK82_028454 [Glycine max]|uniref:Uncharacterized protein n=2 Tax=Glycine subgen. Soja TaxID=1462606 RepID=A0A0R0HUQ6_SOYBN|nr:hypothetical protein JHK87_028368 [Glycine soja]KAG5004440.1 hypothetical protein JHK86_028579 [Glycine max]KAG5127619.1 hypothetical protein JHK82_028454 [Glycine max]KAG5152232.1 hypothetical protein JHK84_028704 [Glycine max]KRH34279.1 hypothetical protein GLYMA_10G174300v4 [Glycine max]
MSSSFSSRERMIQNFLFFFFSMHRVSVEPALRCKIVVAVVVWVKKVRCRSQWRPREEPSLRGQRFHGL